jgi:putative aminopeptidase FrvX
MIERIREDTLNLMKIPGLSGHEDQVRNYIKAELKKIGLKPIFDKFGNTAVTFPGTSPRVMLFTHMDQLGLIVRKITDDGFLKFERVGGVPEKILPGQAVSAITKNGKILSGIIGIKSHHATQPEEKYQVSGYRDLYIDLGMGSADEVRSNGIEIGSAVVYKPSAEIIADDKITGTSVDDRAGCAVLLEVARQLNSRSNGPEVNIVFTVQEEFNLRGALPIAQKIKPEIAIQIDLLLASDTPEMRDFGEIKLGKGPGLSMFSFHGRGTLNGVIPHPVLVDHFEQTASNENINLQKSAHIGALTDLSYVQLVEDGVASIDIGFPVRYSHTAQEMCDLKDLVGLAKLLTSALNSLPEKINLIRD